MSPITQCWFLLLAIIFLNNEGCSGCNNNIIEGDAHVDSDIGEDMLDIIIETETDQVDGPCQDIECASMACPAFTVYIPCGPFIMGLDPSLFPSDPSTVREKPNHEVWLSAYCISITEVTNNDWKQCVGEGVCSPPHEIGCSDIADYYSNDEYSNFPVVNVDWSQANEYCEWSGGRLPTEAEWEKAARGGCELQLPEVCGDEDERLFPWGSDEPVWGNCDRAAYWCSDEVSRPEPVGSHSAGISQYGVWDLAGNVWEWVSDIYSEDYYSQPIECWVDPIGPDSGSQRVIRGGSFFDIISYLRVTSRNGPEELSYSFKTGLRCVYDN